MTGVQTCALPIFEADKVIAVSQEEPSAIVVRDVAKLLLEGGVVVIPTDSVYGIGCAAIPGNPGLERIFDIKGRDRAQTLPWLVADARDLNLYGRNVPAWAQALAKRYWPGALTLVVEASALVPDEYSLRRVVARGDAGDAPALATIALRCPDSRLVRDIARELGVPLATTSANTHGAASATSAFDVEGRLIKMSDLTLDAGLAPIAVASTIVDCTGTEPHILREGAIATAAILRTAGF